MINTDLRNSHIIPEFFYKSMYDLLHRFHIISSELGKPERLQQKGVCERLLCEACEQKFCRWERYANTAFVEGRGISITRQNNSFRIQGIDYKKFKLFQLSLLWRMSVSTLPFFRDVALGPHEERLRLALLNEDPLQPEDYACLLVGVRLDGQFLPDWILEPSPGRFDGQRVYWLVINGILFIFFIGSHALPPSLGLAVLNTRNELTVALQEAREIPFLNDALMKLSVARNSRKTIRSKRK